MVRIKGGLWMKPMRLFSLVFMLIGLFLVSWSVSASTVVELEFRDAPVSDVFQVLGEIEGLNVLIDPSVRGTVSFSLKNLTVVEALDLVTRATGYGYQIMANTLVVATNERLRTEFQNTDFSFVMLDYVTVDAARQLLGIITPNVRYFTDSVQNLVILYGVASDIAFAQTVLKQYDAIHEQAKRDEEQRLALEMPKPVQPVVAVVDAEEVSVKASAESQEVLKPSFIHVQFANGAELLAVLERMYANRTFGWDEQLRLLSGQTTQAEWKMVKELVTLQDLPRLEIKGISQGASRALVLVEYKGRTEILEIGQALDGWVLTAVRQRQVEFQLADRSITVDIRR